MKRTFDFKCSNAGCGHVDADVFLDESEDDKQVCSACGAKSEKVPAFAGGYTKGRFTAKNSYGLR